MTKLTDRRLGGIRGGEPPLLLSSGAKRTAKGRKRRRKKLHGDVMTTFDKVARSLQGDGYSAEGSAAAGAFNL
jgi:hypothetical protein